MFTSIANFAYALKEDEKKLLKVRHSFSVRIYPDIVTNLRITNQQKKLKVVLLRLDLLVAKPDDEDIIKKYMPQIKDQIILFLNKQTTHNFKTLKKRNSVRDKLFVLINNLLFKEMNQRPVTELIFQNVIVE